MKVASFALLALHFDIATSSTCANVFYSFADLQLATGLETLHASREHSKKSFDFAEKVQHSQTRKMITEHVDGRNGDDANQLLKYLMENGYKEDALQKMIQSAYLKELKENPNLAMEAFGNRAYSYLCELLFESLHSRDFLPQTFLMQLQSEAKYKPFADEVDQLFKSATSRTKGDPYFVDWSGEGVSLTNTSARVIEIDPSWVVVGERGKANFLAHLYHELQHANNQAKVVFNSSMTFKEFSKLNTRLIAQEEANATIEEFLFWNRMIENKLVSSNEDRFLFLKGIFESIDLNDRDKATKLVIEQISKIIGAEGTTYKDDWKQIVKMEWNTQRSAMYIGKLAEKLLSWSGMSARNLANRTKAFLAEISEVKIRKQVIEDIIYFVEENPTAAPPDFQDVLKVARLLSPYFKELH